MTAMATITTKIQKMTRIEAKKLTGEYCHDSEELLPSIVGKRREEALMALENRLHTAYFSNSLDEIV